MLQSLCVALFVACSVNALPSFNPKEQDSQKGHLSAMTMTMEETAITDSLLLNQYGLVMAHDAATGYLLGGTFHPVNNWAKTQGAASDHDAAAGFAAQMDCGNRAFDIRALMKDDKLIMHHGSVEVDVGLADALQEVINWLAQHPSEIAFGLVADCDGTSCWDNVTSTLAALNLQVADCHDMDGLTVAQAKINYALPGGGALMMSTGCVQGNYDPTIECYQGDDWCYGYGKDKPMNQLWQYTNTTTATVPPNSLWMTQVHWQYSGTSISLGQLHFSSILDDETQSGVNSALASFLDQGQFGPYFNLVELDYVCDHGLDVQAALARRNLANGMRLAAAKQSTKQ